MPYKAGGRLPGERASKLGHLDVIHSELVNSLVQQFESPINEDEKPKVASTKFEIGDDPLRLIFAVDGSLQVIKSDFPPFKEVAFIKTALLRLDQKAMDKIDPETPHPLALRDLMKDSALHHATALPLKGISLPGMNNYDAIRKIIFESFQDASLNAEPYKTLKWLAYEKWSSEKKKSPSFQCPHCEAEVPGLAYDVNSEDCIYCGNEVYLSDMLGFHLEMGEDAGPKSVATAYMLIHETLLLFTGIRHFWEQNKMKVLSDCLFIKDGPLTLRSQYSKLVIPIRNFFVYAKNKGVGVNIIGQEKTGAFVDHFDSIEREFPERSYLLPSNDYIRREVQHAPDRGEPYGSRTNYGNKLFVKTDKYHHMVLSVPVGEYKDSKDIHDLIGIDRILSTLPKIISNRHEGALMPVQLANGVASLSNYPSASVLKLFAGL